MPFLITTGVLVNSITLVGISFNRYLGVTQVIKDSWQPTKKFCVFISLVVWGISAGIASPNIAAYQYTEMYIFEYADRNDTAEIYKVIPHRMCSTNRHQNVISFTILVAVLFVPMFLAFLWFNLVLAKEMWNRRKMAKKATQENMTRGGEKSSGGSKNTDGSVNSVSKLVVSKEQSANIKWKWQSTTKNESEFTPSKDLLRHFTANVNVSVFAPTSMAVSNLVLLQRLRQIKWQRNNPSVFCRNFVNVECRFQPPSIRFLNTDR
ncbi:unnamed protein product [Hermetia illucens]|uniref:G-protein coupled receptors family 1 profile domain-containing protein n=2 Tax=Hermetia illucens TaxID=343691 RepID=A0A7R8YXJ1_HERIL|nr:unnamed protein product [Hermetia illucens]